jgi:hypothetical protein
VRVVEAVRRVAGAGDAEREQHLPPVPRPEPLPGGGAQLEHGRDRLEERGEVLRLQEKEKCQP